MARGAAGARTPSMLRIEEPSRPAAPGFALWALGFRPFYLLGAAYAALSIVLWAMQFAGWLPFEALPGPSWHGHEMLFGFALAIIAGFLLTAVRNWTQQPTPTGGPLMALVALWVAARIAMYTPWTAVSAALNTAFPLALAVAIGVPLVRAGNRRNYFFLLLLVAIAAATLAMHLSALGVLELHFNVPLRLALDVVLFIVAVVSGRVMPMFTNNGVPGAGAVRVAWLDRVALGAVLVLLAADALEAPAAAVIAIAATGAAAHAARLLLWHPWRTRHTPLVWSLHAAYAWIPIHLALRALAAGGLVLDVLATHALTVGAIGGMTIAMMTRTARGHTGRPLAAGRWEVACYALVQAAALARVAGGALAFEHYANTVEAAAGLWSLAYGIYFVRYWPVLTRARLDGRPG
jgi:uncharacterized protein involved in response to NO